MPAKKIPEPWNSFLSEIDASVEESIELHCLGGFVVTMFYGLPRPTADADVIVISPVGVTEYLLDLAGKGSNLHHKYGL